MYSRELRQVLQFHDEPNTSLRENLYVKASDAPQERRGTIQTSRKLATAKHEGPGHPPAVLLMNSSTAPNSRCSREGRLLGKATAMLLIVSNYK